MEGEVYSVFFSVIIAGNFLLQSNNFWNTQSKDDGKAVCVGSPCKVIKKYKYTSESGLSGQVVIYQILTINGKAELSTTATGVPTSVKFTSLNFPPTAADIGFMVKLSNVVTGGHLPTADIKNCLSKLSLTKARKADQELRRMRLEGNVATDSVASAIGRDTVEIVTKTQSGALCFVQAQPATGAAGIVFLPASPH